LADAVARIGGRVDQLLAGADTGGRGDHGVLVQGACGDRIFLAERRADQGGQRDDHVGFRHQFVEQALVAGVATNGIEAVILAAGRQGGVAAGEGVEHRDFVPFLEKRRSKNGADVTGASGDEHAHAYCLSSNRAGVAWLLGGPFRACQRHGSPIR